MGEYLYRIAGPDALERLYAAGVRILHHLPESVILREPLKYPIDGVTPIVPSAYPTTPEQVRPEEIGEIAFAIRQSDAFRARKANRPAEGEPIDDVIAGTAGRLP